MNREAMIEEILLLEERARRRRRRGPRKERAKWMLDHLMPLDEWLATAGEERLNMCQDVLGGPVEFYQWFKAQLEKLLAEGGA
jgi:hypothetical protein